VGARRALSTFLAVEGWKRSTGYGVRGTSIWKRLLGVVGVVVESVVLEDDDGVTC
jgi:hypothetical protein